MNTWFKKIYYGLFPSICVLCDADTHQSALCTPCRQELPWLDNPCSLCALPCGDTSLSPAVCGACLHQPPPFHAMLALFDYLPPIDYCILSLKFREKLEFAKVLGELLAESVIPHYKGKPLPELLIPVPLHRRRLQERGFNQALEIARPIARKLRIPIDTRNCQRILSTQPQSHEPAEQRRKNLRDAFKVAPDLGVSHVAIIDDVVTTGSTVTELALTLQKSGVKQMDVWCIVRTCLKT